MWNLLLPLLGTYLTSQANTRAAETAANATLQGAQITADAIQQGNEQAQQTLDQMRQTAAPATDYLRSVIADPQSLTPQQQDQLGQLRLDVANQLHSSNFAGSGRTAAALFKKAEGDFRTGAIADNENRALTAANTLQGGVNAATSGIANSQANTGYLTGTTMGNADTKAGLYDASAGLANAKLTGEALGTVGAAINNEQRQSRYDDRMSRVEKALGIS